YLCRALPASLLGERAGSRTSASRLFFFSSRRRHTRFSRDWSSDVCSSDLGGCPASRATPVPPPPCLRIRLDARSVVMYSSAEVRSEERRVGKKYRSIAAYVFRNRKGLRQEQTQEDATATHRSHIDNSQ